MEGYFYSYFRRGVHAIEKYLFLLYIDHFQHVPHGDIWDSAFGYAEETAKIIASLAKRAHANVALVGQKGVGSLGVAKEVATQIHKGSVHGELAGKRVLFVHVDDLLKSSAPGIGQVHAIEKVISEMERSNKYIAVLRGMDGVFAGNYTLSAEDVLHPFFSSPHMRTITILSDEEYSDHIAPNGKLAHLVEKVHIRGLDSAQAKQFLSIHFSSISHEVLDELIAKTESILPHIPYPKRAVDVLQELMQRKSIEPHHVAQYVSKKSGIDMQRFKDAHSVDVQDSIPRYVVNQKQAIAEIRNAIICARSKTSEPKHPVVSLLFVGPSGVGKTETAKALAQTYFGSSQYLIQLDMKQYGGELPEIITEHPYCILLLNNFSHASDVAHEEILSALTRGYILDTFGRKYFTTHMIIIATTTSTTEASCRAELLESFDGVITFTPLSQKHVHEIAHRKLARVNGRLQIEYDVSLDITDELVKYIAQYGYGEDTGAHAMGGLIRSTVENIAIQAVREGKVIPGGKILLDPKSFT